MVLPMEKTEEHEVFVDLDTNKNAACLLVLWNYTC